MLKTKIHEFVSTQQYRTLAELHSNASMREIEVEIHKGENKPILM